ncbi:MAG: type II toxin-antitoxin system prevent-host-death family antitoxin, partial [Anaerolineae bacterium]|nr:type II toxin-antitoxin system prevent-host-death family antitoxin [Anaerolineae bacterium]
MTETITGIRDFKARLSSYVKQVKAGNEVVITERGQPVARLVPINATAEERIEELMAAGLLDWNGEKLLPLHPEVVAKGERTLADLV